MAIFGKLGTDEPEVFGHPPGRPFFDDLVAALLSDCAGHFEYLPDIRIFVPSRRAVRALKESFVRQAPSGVMLLPRITATADLSEEDRVAPGLERRLKPVPEAPPPAIKRLKLASIYRAAMQAAEQDVSWEGALRAASELMRTSDQLFDYGVNAEAFERLEEAGIVDAAAEHWQKITKVLRLITEAYPAWLDEEGLVDARVRRALLLDRLSEELAGDPSRIIIAAGFLGTSPSSQRFLKSVAHHPRGAVILPALDRDMTEEAWQAIEAPHPQSAYKMLLEEVFGGIDRANLRSLPFPEKTGEAERRALLSLALMPAEATHDWAGSFQAFKAGPGAAGALDGLSYAVLPTQEEEADAIALALREVIETPGQTAYLVTADRDLGRRVAAKLGGWGIEIDDSGGAPIRGSFRATFLRLIARLMAEPSEPVFLAGLIHHPLFGLGLDAAERRLLVAAGDAFLRGRKPRAGWDGLEQSVYDSWRPYRQQEGGLATDLISRLRAVFEPRTRQADGSVASLLRAHLAIARDLAEVPGEAGEERLFRFEDGDVLAPHLEQLLSRPDLLGEATLSSYADIFEALLEGPAFRPPGGQHPRLSIFGMLEARLQTADLVVVGGLQEGVWPGEAAIDPFLSRSMRSFLGLPSPEAEIGRVAHDFLDLACQPRVLLTRSARKGRAPVRASRLMIRLESLLKSIDPDGRCDEARRLGTFRRARYGADDAPRPARRPQPTAPSHLKPRRLSISRISTWRRDPYAVYAREILRLRPKRSLGEPFRANDRGDMMHRLLEEFIRIEMNDPGQDIETRLRELLPDIQDQYDMPAEQRSLNARFIERGMEFFARFQARARELSRPVAAEVSGSMQLDAGGVPVEITGIADRIDQFTDGKAHIIDYKLGGQATISEDAHFSPQLFLTAMMLERDGFPGCEGMKAGQVSFLRLSTDDNVFRPSKAAKRRASCGSQLEEDLKNFEANFTSWLEAQYRDDMDFPSQLRPFRSDIAGDYDGLARRGEWAASEDHDE